MNRETSIYLDVVRFCAALVVFLGHVSGQRLTGGFLWQFHPFMSEAVTVFFVLSGFVIGYVTDTRETSATSYVVNRLARIYSVALPALILTFALDHLGRALHPEAYNESWGYVGDGQLTQFLAGVTFTNELWTLHIPQGSNLPYWSLGYEVWYYIVFGLFAFAPAGWRWLCAAAALVVAGPKIAALLPLWLMGLGTYHLCARARISPALGFLCFAGSLAAWVGFELWSWRSGHPLATLGPAMRGELPQDYLVGSLFAVNLIGFAAISKIVEAPLRLLERPIRWAAGATFSVYLLHLPVAQFLGAALPLPPGGLAKRLILTLGVLAVIFAIAAVTERRKDAWRRMIKRIVLRYRPLPA